MAHIRQSRPDSGLGLQVIDLSGRGATRAENAQGTPTQSHISFQYTSIRRECKGWGGDLDLVPRPARI